MPLTKLSGLVIDCGFDPWPSHIKKTVRNGPHWLPIVHGSVALFQPPISPTHCPLDRPPLTLTVTSMVGSDQSATCQTNWQWEIDHPMIYFQVRHGCCPPLPQVMGQHMGLHPLGCHNHLDFTFNFLFLFRQKLCIQFIAISERHPQYELMNLHVISHAGHFFLSHF